MQSVVHPETMMAHSPVVFHASHDYFHQHPSRRYDVPNRLSNLDGR